MTFFPPNGTTDVARQPDEMRVRTSLHPPADAPGNAGAPVLRSIVDAVTSMRQCLCAQERNSRMFVGTLFTLASDTTCIGQSRKTFPNSIARYVPLMNGLFQPVLWSASVAHVSSLPSMARSLKVAVFFNVDGGGSCRSQGYLFGRFCRQRYVFDQPYMRMYQDRHCNR